MQYPLPLLTELKNLSIYEHLDVSIEHKDDEPLNISLHNCAPWVIMVTDVSCSSQFFGALHVGDYILNVNGKSMENKQDFFNYALHQSPRLNLHIARAIKFDASLKSSLTSNHSSSRHSCTSKSSNASKSSLYKRQSLETTPANLKDLQNVEKFDHLEIVVEHEEEEPLNVELKNVAENVILITKVCLNSSLFHALYAGDYILSINGKTFETKESLLRFCIKEKPALKFVVARPKSMTLAQMNRAKSAISANTKSYLSSAIVELDDRSFEQRSPSAASPGSSEPPTPSENSGSRSPAASHWLSPSAKMNSLVKYFSRKSSTSANSPISTQPGQENRANVSSSTSDANRTVSKGSRESSQKKSATPYHFNFNHASIFQEYIVKPNKVYYVAHIDTSKSSQCLSFSFDSVPEDESTVIVTDIDPDSFASNIFMIGDRILSINNVTITNAIICKKLIVESEGKFDVFFERPSKGLPVSGTVRPTEKMIREEKLNTFSSVYPSILNSTYVSPNPEETLGVPLDGYVTASRDVQTEINPRIPVIEKNISFESSNSSSQSVPKNASLENKKDIEKHHTDSELHPDEPLRKP